jgi:putative drug exporter of the RND superfamily
VSRIARFVLGHRLLVALAWMVLAVAGAATGQHTANRLSTSFAFPGQSGYQANMLIARDYGTGGSESPVAVLLTAPPGHSVDTTQADGAFTAARATGRLRILDYADTGNAAFLAAGGHATWALMFPPYNLASPAEDHAPAILAAVRSAAPPGAAV